jgi:hypothetical protein
VTYVVTPSDSAELGPAVGLIVGGAFLSVGGGFMFAWGWRGRRRLV